jgi:hypothetical protein
MRPGATMAIKSVRKDGMMFVAYRRERIQDYLELSTTVNTIIEKPPRVGDVIVDFSQSLPLSEGEIALMMDVAVAFKRQGGRFLRVIATEQMRDRLKLAGLLKVGNGDLYADYAAVKAAIVKAAIVTGEQSA